MYIPSSIPTTLAAMLEFLQPMVADGFFDSVAYDDAESPTKIVCTQDENDILDISVSGTTWTFKPYIAAGIAGGPAGRTPSFVISYLARCSGGAIFSQANYAASNSGGTNFVIAKTKAGKTAFIGFSAPSLTSYNANAMFTTIWGDSMAVPRYTNGFLVTANGLSNDRTILQTIPVFGGVGSTDYFDSVRFRNMAQYYEAGVQIISGKRYGCVGFFAITDDE